jgi:hypothetical protein
MRKNLINIHLILGGFFLPVGLMFAITGGLYTFGFKGSYETKEWQIPAQADLAIELPYLLGVANDVLKVADLEAPSGAAGIKKMGTAWQLEWTGSRADFILESTDQPETLKAQYKKTNTHRFFVQLHKAKGGLIFKILAGAFSVALILLLFSGIMMAMASPDYMRLMKISLGAGTLVTFIALWLG